MKGLIIVSTLLLAQLSKNIATDDDCGVALITKSVELVHDFQFIYERVCQTLKVNEDAYKLSKRKCVQNIIDQFINKLYTDDIIELTAKLTQMPCFKLLLPTCEADSYVKLKHCIFDFALENIQKELEIYKNQTMRTIIINLVTETKDCLQKSLDEIDVNERVKSNHLMNGSL